LVTRWLIGSKYDEVLNMKTFKPDNLSDKEEPTRREFAAAACGLIPTCSLLANSAASQRQNPLSLERDTDDRIAIALMRFKMGFHCSQCMFEAYAEDFGLEPEFARKISAGLAGGSTVGGECGVIGSGYLVLGLKYGQSMPAHGNVAREKKLWTSIKRLVHEFKQIHGSVNCRELLGIDVFTPEGWREGVDKGLFTKKCHNHIRDAITIIDSIEIA
jgi:C_GCAxxG_C_C family probable redox protein